MIGNTHTRQEVLDKLRATLEAGKPIIASGAGTGISAKFIEEGGADLIIIYNSGRFRMAGRGSCAGLLAYGDANQIVMEMGEREVLPVVKHTPVIAGVNGTDPTRRMWHFIGQVKDMGFSGVNNFPTVAVIDGKFRQTLEETDLGYYHEVEMIRISRAMDMFTIVYCFNAEEASQMAEAGADVIIAHVGTTVGGSIGATDSVMSLEQAAETVQKILDGSKAIAPDIIGLSHGGPIATPEDAAYVNVHTDAVGFVGASSIERLATEDSIRKLTEEFKSIPLGQYQI